jgi:DMSO/TMAO reductase YedYZ heme-binding membrane subunit
MLSATSTHWAATSAAAEATAMDVFEDESSCKEAAVAAVTAAMAAATPATETAAWTYTQNRYQRASMNFVWQVGHGIQHSSYKACIASVQTTATCKTTSLQTTWWQFDDTEMTSATQNI